MRSRLGAFALSVAILCVTRGGQGHLRFPTLEAEKLIELRLSEEPMRIGYRVGFGAKRAAELRREADRDGDGVVSAAEGNAALDTRTASLLEAVRVCVGRSLSKATCRKLAPRDVERVEAEGWAPGPSGHLHFSWTFRLAESARDSGALRFEDAYEVPGVGITDVQITPPAHAALIRAGDAAVDAGVSERFTWIEKLRTPGPRSVVAAWPAPRESRAAVLGLVGLGVLCLGAWLATRKRRKRKTC